MYGLSDKIDLFTSSIYSVWTQVFDASNDAKAPLGSYRSRYLSHVQGTFDCSIAQVQSIEGSTQMTFILKSKSENKIWPFKYNQFCIKILFIDLNHSKIELNEHFTHNLDSY